VIGIIEGYNAVVKDVKESAMELLIGLALLVILDIAALRAGTDSRDDIESAEWARRAA